MMEWWKPLAAAFRPLAERMRHSEIEPFPTASLCILHTCSNLQLGRLCHIVRRFPDMSSEDKKLIRPGQFRTDLSDAIHDVVVERLDNWDQYMTSRHRDTVVTRWILRIQAPSSNLGGVNPYYLAGSFSNGEEVAKTDTNINFCAYRHFRYVRSNSHTNTLHCFGYEAM